MAKRKNPKKAKPKTKRVAVELQDLKRLMARVAKRDLEPGDWELLSAIVGEKTQRAEMRFAHMIAKAAEAAARAAEQNASSQPDDNSVVDGEEADAADSGADPSPTSDDSQSGQPAARPTTAQGNKPKAPGHGRNGSSAYTNATHTHHGLADGVVGSTCERCKACAMTTYREKIVVKVVGQPLFGAELHHQEQARCRHCGNVVKADLPADVTAGIGSSYVTYHWSACAMLAVMHYFAGMPFKRLEALQGGWGVPLADANQWEVVSGADTLLLPLLKALERYCGTRAMTLRIDDTGAKVISILRQINVEIAGLAKAGKSIDEVRTGINATGAYFETPDGTVTLYYTGLHHAGEIFDTLAGRFARAVTSKLAKVTDGATKNFSHEHADSVTESVCNAHALLKFRDVKDKFPDEYAVAGAVYKDVFDNDDVARAEAMSPEKRMAFHHARSLPRMEALRAMCAAKLAAKTVEPRSPLWQPLTFIINQWDRLTRFCFVPGVPLDTNLVEQSLIIPVRYLAASFGYKTATGAEVGDHFMSLVVTACDNDVEPVEWLTNCLENHADLATRPEYYFPWAYRDRAAASGGTSSASGKR